MQISEIMAREIAFSLFDVVGVEDLDAIPRYQEQSAEIYQAVLETAQKVASDHFAPHNRKGDLNEPRVVNGVVELIPEVSEAMDAYREAGFFSAHHDEDDGGLQIPWTVTQAASAFFQAANVSTAGYPFLTVGAANLIKAHASADQQAKWLPPMLAGEFFGTMCLSEPHAGSGLADIKTTAYPIDGEPGKYRLKGQKMWISAGDHELGDNIVHLVLARVEGAPAGTKGISIFIVPKRRVDAQGEVGQSNDVRLISLNHKMGFRGTTNTILAFGEDEGCVGELIGEAGQGLAYMFHMMNEARIGVGLGAACLGLAGYAESLRYAEERPQGRHPEERDPTSKPVMIIEHADVRRMLMAQKALCEPSLTLCLYAAKLVDIEKHHPSPEKREQAHTILDLLTPVVKGWISDVTLRANHEAIQIHGGYGYTRDFQVEQIYRDNRLNPIHEGTNGIQGMDLLGRKVMRDGGKALGLFSKLVQDELKTCVEQGFEAQHAEQLRKAMTTFGAATAALGGSMQAEGARKALAQATLYLDAFGLIVMAWMHAKCVAAAQSKGTVSGDYAEGKALAAGYFFRHELSRMDELCHRLSALDDTFEPAKAANF